MTLKIHSGYSITRKELLYFFPVPKQFLKKGAVLQENSTTLNTFLPVAAVNLYNFTLAKFKGNRLICPFNFRTILSFPATSSDLKRLNNQNRQDLFAARIPVKGRVDIALTFATSKNFICSCIGTVHDCYSVNLKYVASFMRKIDEKSIFLVENESHEEKMPITAQW